MVYVCTFQVPFWYWVFEPQPTAGSSKVPCVMFRVSEFRAKAALYFKLNLGAHRQGVVSREEARASLHSTCQKMWLISEHLESKDPRDSEVYQHWTLAHGTLTCTFYHIASSCIKKESHELDHEFHECFVILCLLGE